MPRIYCRLERGILCLEGRVCVDFLTLLEHGSRVVPAPESVGLAL